MTNDRSLVLRVVARYRISNTRARAEPTAPQGEMDADAGVSMLDLERLVRRLRRPPCSCAEIT
ncbi:MAG: hypothetical protein ACRENE_16410 [Polyangiaceae bacterium]